MEEPGFEPGTFRMRSGHSTTELHPQHMKRREENAATNRSRRDGAHFGEKWVFLFVVVVACIRASLRATNISEIDEVPKILSN